jgi:hypothetical protein
MARRLPAVAALAALWGLAGCNVDNLLKVKDIDVAQPGTLQGPTALPANRGAALGDFQVAYSGAGATAELGTTNEGQINMSALLSDEFINAETFPTRLEVDFREIQVTNSTTLSRARATTENAAKSYAQYGPTEFGYAEVTALAGYTYILFGENYCNGVPYSAARPDGSFEYGQPLPSDSSFRRAVQKFDSAVTIANAAYAAALPNTAPTDTAALRALRDTLVNLASVGKGRALLDRDQPAAAALAVGNVPTDFTYLVRHSANTTRENNGIWELVFNEKRFSQSKNEGGSPLDFRSTDPRVAFRSLGRGFDNATPVFAPVKYEDRDKPAVLASGIEARLIEAEADVRAGNATYLTILNTLRATIGLGPLTDPGTAAGRRDQVFAERAYWLYLTSHRVGDLRRLIRQYGQTADVFPHGAYFKGGTYGPDVNFPIPDDERNNPNLKAAGVNDRNCLNDAA